jgi:hypothetical protein
MLLSVLIGNGVQITIMSLITLSKIFYMIFNGLLCIYLVFACLGFLSPASRGALMTCKYFIRIIIFKLSIQVLLFVMYSWEHRLVLQQLVYIKVRKYI